MYNVAVAGAPSGLEVEDSDDKSVTLKWQKPRDDGGSKVQGYIVEARPAGGEWHQVTPSSRPIRGTEATIDGLETGEKMEFRVMAKNEAGLSQPSQATRPVELKPKFSTFARPKMICILVLYCTSHILSSGYPL